MTSTAVKEVSTLFANMTAAQAGKSTAGISNFQAVWSNQMSKNTQGNAAQNNAAGAAKKQSLSNEQLRRGASLKAKESQTVQTDSEEVEMSSEEQEQAMAVLGTAALELMQEIADALGITMEELQAAMGDLEMDQLDVLDASKLSGLLLKLGGAEDLYALVTDGELYDSYRMLMDRLNDVLQESADGVGKDPEQLLVLLQDKLEESAPVEEGFVQAEQSGETYADRMAEQSDSLVAADAGIQEAVQNGQEAQNQGRSQSEGRERDSKGRTEGEPQVNPFLQNLRAEQFQPDAGQVQGAAQNSPWSESTQNIMNQILDYMKLQLNGDSTSLEMQLHPASLGTLQIQLASKAGVVTANFIAQNEAVKAALETQMVQLKEQFAEQGIKVEAIEVTVQTHEFERNLDEQGRDRSSRQPEKKGRARRIGAGGAVSMEDVPEEEPVADRVAASGSTVEYTA